MRMRPSPTFVFICALLCRVVNASAVSDDQASSSNPATLKPRETVFVETSTVIETNTFNLVDGIETDVATLTEIFTVTSSRSEQTPATSTQQSSTISAQQPSPTSTLTFQTSTTSSQSATQALPTGQEMTASPPTSSGKKPRAAAIAGGVVGAIFGLGIFLLLFHILRRPAQRKNAGHLPLDEEMSSAPPFDEKGAHIATTPRGPTTSTGPSWSGTVGTVQAARDPNLLAEQVRVLQAQLQAALQAQGDASTSESVAGTASKADGHASSVTRPLSTMKREQTLTVQNWDPIDLVVHTDSGLRLEPAQPVEELPPVYVERKSFAG